MRTDCEQARERVSLLLDDELSPHESALLDRHLAACGECTAFASDVRAYTHLLRAAPLEPAPQSWLLRRPAASRLAAQVAAVTAAAAAAVLVAVSTISLNGRANQATAEFGYSPAGLTVHSPGAENLGVQRLPVEHSFDGPRRGQSSTV
ncbi:MAG TPA: zf-HC2 domain-containing protein [Thermoanaerobaculia bacterium]|nr:zf-HC2 domain-containing protein [Thermoanaerobaculia bacterium]